MRRIIDVQIGEIKGGQGKVILRSKAIGSCIAIAAYDGTKNIGALAHVMLPGSAPANKEPSEKTKYAADAIDAMVCRMNDLGSKRGDIEMALVGGGNVLNRKEDTICRDNIESALELLRRRQLRVKAHAVGGTNRRSVSLDVEHGIVSYTEGNGSEMELWRPQKAAE
jgi:chemotaxis protein CheD